MAGMVSLSSSPIVWVTLESIQRMLAKLHGEEERAYYTRQMLADLVEDNHKLAYLSLTTTSARQQTACALPHAARMNSCIFVPSSVQIEKFLTLKLNMQESKTNQLQILLTLYYSPK